MNKIAPLFLGLFALIVLLSCENKIGKLEPKVVAPANMCDSIKYNAHIKPIIINNCAVPACHVPGGTGPEDFNTYSGVNNKVPFMKNRINSTTNSMPPATHGGKMSQSKIDSIECWIDKGAPNN
jgi:hypothetical protein